MDYRKLLLSIPLLAFAGLLLSAYAPSAAAVGSRALQDATATAGTGITVGVTLMPGETATPAPGTSGSTAQIPPEQLLLFGVLAMAAVAVVLALVALFRPTGR